MWTVNNFVVFPPPNQCQLTEVPSPYKSKVIIKHSFINIRKANLQSVVAFFHTFTIGTVHKLCLYLFQPHTKINVLVMHDILHYRLHDRVHDKVYDWLHDRGHDRFHDRVHDRLHERVHVREPERVNYRVHIRLNDRLHDRLHDRVA